MEGSDDASVAMSDSQVEGGETPSKVEEGPVEEPCDGGKAGLSNLAEAPAAPAPAPGATAAATPATEAAAGVTLKVATTVLHPVCLGESPLMLPIHLQMARAAGPQLGQMGAAPYLIASQNPVPLPLMLDQQVLQHVGPPVLPQSAGCAQLPLQGGVLCQNPFGLPPPSDQKSAEPPQDANLLSLLQNPAFAAIVQDLFPSQAAAAASSSCQSPGSAFFPMPPPPPFTAPYASPLAPLVPPATLLVPYPVIIPLPVPLPVPLPIPVPVPLAEDSKGNLPKPVCTVSRSTQTSPKDTTSPAASARSCKPPPTPPSSFQPPAASPLSPPAGDGEALDLSVRGCPVQLKQEYPSPQPDSVLDLSVRAFRSKPLPPNTSAPATATTAHLPPGSQRSQSLDSKLLGSLASLEFSRQHKWVVDSAGAGGSACSASRNQEASLGGGGNLEIVSASQTAKVIVSVKDGIPAILCGKIKGLSGVSTKNFSIKRDGTAGASLQQLYGVPSGSQGEPGDPNNALKKVPKSRAIKLKKVSSQEIHFLPVKKQRLAALLPRK
ncbi:retinoic acid-induced protein 2 [Nelusetta ayraudi]|uniref:retinoic acid-induced protein 2 n=1 Tax=Nelusetta ayraudi TaxID=303726 RepID=UPI003F711484